MQSNLGIYIGKNIIKYAKLQKEKDSVKVDACNVVFYEDNELEKTLNKIINETFSYKIPISINLSDEVYTSFNISSLLSKTDAKKAIDLEYQMFCDEKGYNKNIVEHKYFIVDGKGKNEEEKTISIIANKNSISKRVELFSGKRINAVMPLPISISNLVENDGRENIAIVNIEEKIQITTIVDGQISQVDILDEGMQKILEEINRTENSFSKSYEVCKNLTIYNPNISNMYSETNEYMDVVTEELQKIVRKVKAIIGNSFFNIDKIYITGLGTCINNIDLFFQDNITSSRCEILKPYFTKMLSAQAPIKDYIEVNSAIALALDGIGMLNKNVNFAKGPKTSSGNSFLSKDISDIFGGFGQGVESGFGNPVSSIEKLLIRGIAALATTSLLFCGFSSVISKNIENKTQKVAEATTLTQTELSKVDADISAISARTKVYKDLIKELTSTDDSSSISSNQRIISKDSIPNLLNRIMFVIPKKVKLTSIKNTTSKHIVINAEAEKYEQLGYFKAVLTTNGILTNVKSSSGTKNGDVVQVTIEGDLP